MPALLVLMLAQRRVGVSGQQQAMALSVAADTGDQFECLNNHVVSYSASFGKVTKLLCDPSFSSVK